MSNGKKKNASDTLGDNISQLYSKYIPYWPLFLILTAISLGWAWYKLQHEVPLYSASIKILIKDETKSSKITEDISLGTPKNDIENQIEVIRSLPLMVQVVKNLGLYAPIYEEGKFVPHSAYEKSPVVVIAKSPDSIIESGRVNFSYNEKQSSVVFDNKSYPLDSWVNTRFGVLKFSPNKYYYGRAKGQLYFTLIDPQNIAPAFAGSLQINPSKSSSIIGIDIVDEVPTRAENVLNELMSVYAKASIDEKNKLAANTLSFVENRLGLVARDLDSIEDRIQNFRANKTTYDVGRQGAFFLQNVGELDKNVENINMQLSVLKEAESYVLSSNTSDIVPSTFGINDPVLTQLITRLYEAKTQYSKLKETTGENHPSMVALSGEIAKLRPSILEHIQNLRNTLITNRSNLKGLSNSYTGMLEQAPQKERQLLDINREQAIKNNIYTFLLQKREETFLSYASTVPDSRVINSAVSSHIPISPNARKTYLMAVALAFGISILLITGKEVFSRTVMYRHEIESLTSIPVIAEIGYNNSKTQLITEDTKSFLPENFRKLRTSLTFLGIGAKRKKILVTSTIPGEGKSFVAANLGLSLAMAGKKVIMLEFDLVNPTLSKKINVFEEEGLTNYLLDEKEPEEIIKRSSVHENLFIIPSGPLPMNPSELILSDKVKTLLDYLNETFDAIIIDTAPVGPMTDAYVLSSYCDTTLYIVRHQFTPKELIQRIDEENKVNVLKNSAIVFNAVKQRGFGTSYGYGYGYGYGTQYLNPSKPDTNRKRLTHKNNR